MTPLKPWEEPNSPYKTKSQYFGVIRAGLRKMWTRYRLKNNFVSSLRYLKDIGGVYKTGKKKGKPRTQWYAVCQHCQVEHPCTNMEVDHIISAGTLTEFEHISSFTERLLCGTSGMRYLCKQCHSVYTVADKYGLTFEEGVLKKCVIGFEKLAVTKQKTILSFYFSEEEYSNKDKRKLCFATLVNNGTLN